MHRSVVLNPHCFKIKPGFLKWFSFISSTHLRKIKAFALVLQIFFLFTADMVLVCVFLVPIGKNKWVSARNLLAFC